MTHNQNNTSLGKNEKLNSLLLEIERQLNWGSSHEWSGSDFDQLSDLIFEKTQERLSVTTLKRVWGRTSQTVSPSHTTLDILSRYAGAKNWRDFEAHHSLIANKNYGIRATGLSGKSVLRMIGISALGVLILFLAFSLASREGANPAAFDDSDVTFDIQKVTTGIPNTVVFRYDLNDFPADTIELQQSWDERRRTMLDPNNSLVTATYFRPGYFNAKLVADGKIIKSEHLYLPSQGMQVMTFLKDEEVPRFLPQEYWSTHNGIELQASYDDTFHKKEKERLLMVNLMEEPVISPDKFEMQVSFRLEAEDEGDPCHTITIIITGAEDVYMFRLGHPGCAGKFNSYLGGSFIEGTHADLSKMGFLEGDWVDVTVSKNEIEIFFSNNGKDLLLTDTVASIGLIGGVQIYSTQKIAIRQLEICDENLAIDLLR